MDDMISKKELLEQTGISYGQLYRWKRENLIPEEWFLKQSSYTGQETFFPRDKVLERVNTIMELKDRYSLEDLAKLFDPGSADPIGADKLDLITEIDESARTAMLDTWKRNEYSLTELAIVASICELTDKAGLSQDATEKLVRNALTSLGSEYTTKTVCTLISANDEAHMVFSIAGTQLLFDAGVAVGATCSVGEKMKTLRSAHKELFGLGV